MKAQPVLLDTLVPVWETCNQVTIFLVNHLPRQLWNSPVPGAPRRTVRMIMGHIHNSRCMWIKTIGAAHGIQVPASVDRRHVTQKQLVSALLRSSRGIVSLLRLGCEHGGTIPPNALYRWRNLPLDVGHVLAYFVAHEAHHRGQILMLSRQVGMRLSSEVSGGIWQWTKRKSEARGNG